MEPLKILIVEDEFIIATNIKRMLDELGYRPLIPVYSKKDAIQILAQENIDMVLLDINLNGKTEGIEIAQYIKDNLQIPFLFLTSISNKLIVDKAIKTGPNAYLLKPFKVEDLNTAIEIAINSEHKKFDFSKLANEQEKPKSFFIKSGSKYHRIIASDIIYFKAEDKSVMLYGKNNTTTLLKVSLDNMLHLFEVFNFIQIHRSIVVNLNMITSMDRDNVFIEEIALPIGRQYRENLSEKINAIN